MKKLLTVLVLLVAVVLGACGPEPESAVMAVPPQSRVCTVVVDKYEVNGLSGIYGTLGFPYSEMPAEILLNGEVTKTEEYITPQPGDVVSLVNADPQYCTGEYNRALHQSFDSYVLDNFGGAWDWFDNFQSPGVSPEDLKNTFVKVCRSVRSNAGHGFDGDLVDGGCNYLTLMKYSLADGTEFCEVYDFLTEAYAAAQGVSDIRSIAVAAEWIPTNKEDFKKSFCP